MIGVNGRVARRGEGVQPVRLDVREQELPLSVKRRMVVLAGQDLIGALLSNSLGHLFLAPHGVDLDNGALQFQ